ncbi:MAG: ATP-dependent DNA helicase RecG [Fibrobacterota bacterium]
MPGKMKPPVLPNSSLDALSGIGEKRVAAFHAYGLHTVDDLFRFLPRAYLNRARITPLSDLEEGVFSSVVGRIQRIQPMGRQRLVVTLEDNTGRLSLVWFKGFHFLLPRFEEGKRLNAWGKITRFRNEFQLSHPDLKFLEVNEAPEKGVFPVYVKPETLSEAAIDSKIIAAAVRDALERTREILPEAVPAALRMRNGFPAIKEVYRKLHFPEDDSPAAMATFLRRLKYEEAFLLCLKMEKLSRAMGKTGLPMKLPGALSGSILKNAGFAPTIAQRRVLADIEAELAAGRPFKRLLQGDVGSGKTFVCAVFMAHIIENGYQAALMAPTEILARQHFIEMERLFAGTGVQTALFVSGQSKSERAKLDRDLAAGRIGLAVGTHALLSPDVVFGNLGAAVVDEQHRFGVLQRLALRRKGGEGAPALMVASATPIPRTLALTLYGDLALSVINELPPGRIPVKTHRVPENKRSDMVRFIRDKVASGGRAFFILPLVEASEKMQEVTSLAEMHERLQRDYFPGMAVEKIHGRMPVEEKEAALARFRSGESRLLAATTVVEVGIDIPQADVMVVENPERFGLAQLHQLRGRVGRGNRESFCFLLPGLSCSEGAYERLGKFAATNDGFIIAELDFEARGAGDLAGYRQSGSSAFKFLDLLHDMQLIETAKKDAVWFLENIGETTSEEQKYIEKVLNAFADDDDDVLQTA